MGYVQTAASGDAPARRTAVCLIPFVADSMHAMVARSIPTNSWLRGIPADLIDEIASVATPRRYQSGDLVRAQADPSTFLCGIVSGVVRVSSFSTCGREWVNSILGSGEWFGHVGLLDGWGQSHEIRACQDTTLVSLGRRAFEQILNDHPILYRHLAMLQSKTIRAALSRLDDEALLGFEARLAKQLITLADNHGIRHPNGEMINLHLPQRELAAICSVSRQTVSRRISAWQQRGWVDIHYGKVFVRDRRALMRLFAET